VHLRAELAHLAAFIVGGGVGVEPVEQDRRRSSGVRSGPCGPRRRAVVAGSAGTRWWLSASRLLPVRVVIPVDASSDMGSHTVTSCRRDHCQHGRPQDNRWRFTYGEARPNSPRRSTGGASAIHTCVRPRGSCCAVGWTRQFCWRVITACARIWAWKRVGSVTLLSTVARRRSSSSPKLRLLG
jgi:hypothetical protein